MIWLLLGAALAEEGPVDPFTQPDEADLLRAEQALVTVASRYAQTVRQAASIVTVITDEEIRRRGFRTLSDVLRTVPGVYLSSSSEGRTLAGVRGVTGTDNNKVLLLIDGVPFYDGVYTHAWLDEYIPLVHVRQIEVIKGPGAVVYGTNAFAGVLNVVTYRAGDVDGGFARVEVGSFDRSGAAAVAGHRFGDQGAIRGYVRSLSLDGDGMDRTPGGGYDVHGLNPRQALSGGLDIRIGELTLRYDHIDYQHTYFVNSQDDLLSVLTESADEFGLRYRNDFFSARYDLRPIPGVLINPYVYAQLHNNPGSYGYITETTGEVGRVLVDTRKETERYGAGLQTRRRWGPRLVTIGGIGVELNRVLALEDRVFEDDSGEPVSPSVFGADQAEIWDTFIFSQHTWTAWWWLELTAGLRLDAHSYAGIFPSPRAGMLIVTDDGVIKLLYGRAFRAPNARELLVEVIPDSDGANAFTSGNPDLDAETIDTIEVEFSGDIDETLALRGAAFGSVVSSAIGKVTGDDPVLGDQYYGNGPGSRILGAEGEVGVRLDRLRASGNYAYTLAIDAETSRRVYEFPPHMAHLQVSFSPVPGLWLSGMADLYGSRPRAEWSPDAGLDDGPPFGLLHAAMSTDAFAGGRVRLDASVRNFLDTSYETLVSVEDANAVTTGADGETVAKYPRDIPWPNRNVVIGIEVTF